MNEQAASGEAVGMAELGNAAGLHARPAVKLTKLAKGFAAEIRLASGSAGPWVDAKSLVKVMAMKLPRGARLHLQARGADAEPAIAALLALIGRNFDEAAGATAADHAGPP